jgi:hypothetical protein
MSHVKIEILNAIRARIVVLSGKFDDTRVFEWKIKKALEAISSLDDFGAYTEAAENFVIALRECCPSAEDGFVPGDSEEKALGAARILLGI